VDESENWLPLPFTTDYEVSDQGRVRSMKDRENPRVLVSNPRTSSRQKGQRTVCLYIDNGVRVSTVQALVMQTFVGPRPHGYRIEFLNGDPADCRLANLEYRRGRKSLTTPTDVWRILWMKKKLKLSTKFVARHVAISEAMVRKIAAGEKMKRIVREIEGDGRWR
jgi:hypothetical protein